MDKIPCPGCRTPLDAEVTCCPICTRPRSKYEITRAYAHMREDASRRRKLPFIVLGWLLLAAAAGYAAWQYRAPILSAVAAGRAKVSGFADYSMDPKNLVAKTAETPAASTATVEAPVQPFASAPAAPAATAPGTTVEPPPGPDPHRQAVMPTAAPTPKAEPQRMPAFNPASQWLMYGRAYDIVSLKPAENVQLLFQGGEGGGVIATVNSDELGRYAVALPRLQEGSITALAGDSRFAPFVFCESDIPYRTLPAEERRALARSALDGDVRPASLSDTAGDGRLQRDLFLAPAR
jgi:hypothetical protein